MLTAGEVAWWVEPDARGWPRALRRAERWAAEMGAHQIQMIAPATNARVGRLYQRRGYRPLRQAIGAGDAAMSAVTVVDEVLPDGRPAARLRRRRSGRRAVAGWSFRMVTTSRRTRSPWIARAIRRSRQRRPCAAEPRRADRTHYIHTDTDMGDWTAIAYLTDAPPAGDGTTFWRWKATGCLQSVATSREEQLAEWAAWRDRTQWEPWTTVAARPNRVVLFPAAYFHSRAIADNYGIGDTARLIQVVFGTGTFPEEGRG